MVTAVDVDTVEVATLKVADAPPEFTVTLAGTVAAVVLSLESVTTAPPAGAGPLKVRVPVEPDPPTTLDGFTAIELSTTVGAPPP